MMRQRARVYVIACEGSPLLKIGVAGDCEKRLRSLQIGCPYELFLVFQRFYYAHLDGSRESFVKLFGMIFLFSLCVSFFVLKYTVDAGRIFGWLSATVWTVYQIPQIMKIYMSKSTKGLSFAFVLIMGLGVSLEFFSSIVLRLPWPTIFSCFRGMLAYFVFITQFLIYRISMR